MNDREVKRYEAADYDQVTEFIKRVSNVIYMLKGDFL